MICYQKYSRQLTLFLLLTAGLFCRASSTNANVVNNELGERAILVAQDRSSDTNHQIKWMKKTSTVAQYKDRPKVYGQFQGRVEISNDGTLTFLSTTKTDEGTYRCDIFHKDGTKISSQDVTLNLYVRVSKPVLNVICKSPKEVNITCFVANGTKIHITLHGDSMIQTVQGSYLEKKFSFRKTGNKNYSCIAKNEISEAKSVEQVNCDEKKWSRNYQIIMLAGIIALGMIMLFLFICLIIKCCRSQTKKRAAKPYPYQGELTEEREIDYVNQSKASRSNLRETHVEYSSPHPQPKPRKSTERGERMREGERACSEERKQGGRNRPREGGVRSGGTTPRVNAYGGKTPQRGEGPPKTEAKEPRGRRGPVPIPPV
ncbi:T-cell surface antigen CD2-like isoform X1 [Amblyraja radiata]|uniref:T-cell surface antigen CD2-like isoform X1 n=1 Tax=Amblyraja radiata TaxID=386614 RepID=UPI0014029B3F|nr:T-cell surface antigen CD2-like isoform X1 [Amblyraja radiata]